MKPPKKNWALHISLHWPKKKEICTSLVVRERKQNYRAKKQTSEPNLPISETIAKKLKQFMTKSHLKIPKHTLQWEQNKPRWLSFKIQRDQSTKTHHEWHFPSNITSTYKTFSFATSMIQINKMKLRKKKKKPKDAAQNQLRSSNTNRSFEKPKGLIN